MVVSPGVRHLPELLSVTERTLVHGDIGKMTGVMEIFELPVIRIRIRKYISVNPINI